MPNDKEIKIKAVLDAQGFDQSVTQLKQKLRNLQQTGSGLGAAQKTLQGDTLMGKYAKEAFGDFSRESLQQLQKMYQTQRQEAVQQTISMREKKTEVEKLQKLGENINKQDRERLNNLKEELNLLRQKHTQTVQMAGQTKAAMGSLQDDLGGGTPYDFAAMSRYRGLRGMGLGPGLARAGAVVGGAGAMVGGLAAAAGGTAMGALDIYNQFTAHRMTRDRQLLGDVGQTTQGANIGFQDVMGGRGYRRFFEQGERSNALQMAMSEREARMARDPLVALRSALLQGAAGAAIGAGAGSFLPGVGTLAGGIIGGIGGAGRAIFGDRQNYNMLFDRDAYEADVNRGTVENFRANILAQRLANPAKFAAEEQFGQRQQRFQQFQRALGVSDAELLGEGIEAMPTRERGQFALRAGDPFRNFKNFKTVNEDGKIVNVETDASLERRRGEVAERNAARRRGLLETQMTDRFGQAAFSEERIMGNINQILQAGGTTQFAREGGGRLSAELQRMGYTAAPQELGALAGITGGGVAETEQAYLRILSEGMRLGIDNSKMRQESREFARIATQIMVRTQGAEGAVSVFGAGVVEATRPGMQAAQEAFRAYSQEAGQGTGYRGALKYAFLNSESGRELFKNASGKLNTQEMAEMQAYFTSANLENLDVDDPMVQYYAEAEGITPEQALKNINKIQKSGINFSRRADMLGEQFQDQYKSYLGTRKDTAAARKEFLGTSEGKMAMGKAFAAIAFERGDEFSQQLAKTKAASVFMRTGELDMADVAAEVTKGPGTLADKAEAATSKDQMTQLQVLNDQMGILSEAMVRNRDASIEQQKAVVVNSAVIEALTNFLKEGATEGERTVLQQLLDRIQGREGEETANVPSPTVGAGAEGRTE